MIDQFQSFLLLGVTLLLAFIVVRVVQSDLSNAKKQDNHRSPVDRQPLL